ncbi:MAG: VWA domain-containing protein [Candidatus Micrarchaeota archaeon]
MATQKTCGNDTNCSFWEACSNYKCIANEGFCSSDYDCETGRCSNETHICEAKRDRGARMGVVLLMDSSGSMGNKTKMNDSKSAAFAAIDAFDDNTNFALISFGDGWCRGPDLRVGFTSNKGDVKFSASKLEPFGGTLIAKSLQYSYDYIEQNLDYKQTDAAYLLLFTDGEETCGGNPCETARVYSSWGIGKKVPTYTIAYMLGDNESAKDELKCIANVTGGRYYEAPTPDALREAFVEAAADIEEDYEYHKLRNLSFFEGLATKMLSPCSSDSDCFGNNVCVNKKCSPSVLHIVFVPVNWYSGNQAFNEEADKQAQFLIDTLPSLAGCKNRIKITKLNRSCNFPIDPEGSKKDIYRIKTCANDAVGIKGWTFLNPLAFDYAVGVGEQSIFTYPTVGYSTHTGTVFFEKGYEVLTAHELGHEFGLHDEYCNCTAELCGYDAWPNPLRVEYGCDPNGNCCRRNESAAAENGGACMFGLVIPSGLADESNNTTRICISPYPKCYTCCEGNLNEKGGRSIMSYANAEGPRYHDEPSLDYLKTVLRCP